MSSEKEYRITIRCYDQKEFASAPSAMFRIAKSSHTRKADEIISDKAFSEEAARSIVDSLKEMGYDASLVPVSEPVHSSGFSVRRQMKLAENMPSDTVHCPNCGSTQIQLARKGGFDWGKAAFGTVLFGAAIGGAAGLIGSGDSVTVCSNCGHKF